MPSGIENNVLQSAISYVGARLPINGARPVNAPAEEPAETTVLQKANIGGLPPFDTLKNSDLIARIRLHAEDRGGVVNRQTDRNFIESAANRFFAPEPVREEPARIQIDINIDSDRAENHVEHENPAVTGREAALDALKAALLEAGVTQAELDAQGVSAKLDAVIDTVLSSDRVRLAMSEAELPSGSRSLLARGVSRENLVSDMVSAARLVLAEDFPVDRLGDVVNARSVDVKDAKSMLVASEGVIRNINARLETFGNHWQDPLDTIREELRGRLSTLEPGSAGYETVRTRLDSLETAEETLRAARRNLLGKELEVKVPAGLEEGKDVEDQCLEALEKVKTSLEAAEQKLDRTNAFYHKIPGFRAFFGKSRLTNANIQQAVEAERHLMQLIRECGGRVAESDEQVVARANREIEAFKRGDDIKQISNDLKTLRHQLSLTGLASLEKKMAKAFECCQDGNGAAKPGSYTVKTAIAAGAALKLAGFSVKAGLRWEFVSKVTVSESGSATIMTAKRVSIEGKASYGWGQVNKDGAEMSGIGAGTTIDSSHQAFGDLSMAGGLGPTLTAKAEANVGYQFGKIRGYSTVSDMVSDNCSAMAVRMIGGKLKMSDSRLRKMAAQADNVAFKRLLTSSNVIRRVDEFSARKMNHRVNNYVKVRDVDFKAGAMAELDLPVGLSASARAELGLTGTSRTEVKFKSVFDPTIIVENVPPVLDLFQAENVQLEGGNVTRMGVIRLYDELRKRFDDFQAAVGTFQRAGGKDADLDAHPGSEKSLRTHLDELGISGARSMRAEHVRSYVGQALGVFARRLLAIRRQNEVLESNQPRERVLKTALEKRIAKFEEDILLPADFHISRPDLEKALYLKNEGQAKRAVDFHFRVNGSASFSPMQNVFGQSDDPSVAAKADIPVINPTLGGMVEFDVHAPFKSTSSDPKTISLTIGLSNMTGIADIITYVTRTLESNAEKVGMTPGDIARLVRDGLIREELTSAFGSGLKVGLTKLAGAIPPAAAANLMNILGGLDGLYESDLALRFRFVKGMDGSMHVDAFSVVTKTNTKVEYTIPFASFGIPIYASFGYSNVSEIELSGKMCSSSLHKPRLVRSGVNGRGNTWRAFVDRNRKNVDSMLRDLRADRSHYVPGEPVSEAPNSVAAQFRAYLEEKIRDENARDEVHAKVVALLDRYENEMVLAGQPDDLIDVRADIFGKLLDLING